MSSSSSSNRTRLADLATPQTFPVGPPARRELRRMLAKSTDPAGTIATFRDTHSLHSMFGRAFGTRTAAGSADEEAEKKKEGGGGKVGGEGSEDGPEKKSEKAPKRRSEEETFRPDPALTFLRHLSPATHSLHMVHRRIGDALRAALEDEIERAPLPQCRDALLGLLLSAWQYVTVSPELRPVVAAVVRKLGDGTPRPVLQRLAEREQQQRSGDEKTGAGGGGGAGATSVLKHAELLAQFSLPMRRLVYEADWEASHGPDGGSGDGAGAGKQGTLNSPNVLADLVRPAVERYRADETVRAAADLAFVGTVGERRVATQARRTTGGTAAGGVSSSTTTAAASSGVAGGALASITSSASGAKSASHTAADAKKSSSGGGGTASSGDTADGQQRQQQPSSGEAVATIREIVGDRPKLLGAVLDMLIAEHGCYYQAPPAAAAESSATAPPSSSASASAEEGTASTATVLGGSTYLGCTLAADILLTYGQLPRQYEHVGIMAKVLDNAVKVGTVTDDAVAQVQGCLRVIFQQKDASAAAQQGGGEAAADDGGKAKAKLKVKAKAKAEADAAAAAEAEASKKTIAERDDSDYVRKLLRRIVTAAVRAMKESDPRGLFLNPVTDEIAPGYSSVIKEPMCIRTIEDKSDELEYDTLQQYERDVNLMFQNCINYNIGKEGTWFRGEARRQQKLWRDQIASQARTLYKKEMAKRKKQLERADMQQDEKRRHQEQIKKNQAAAAAAKVETTQDRKRRADQISRALVAAQDFTDDDAISRLTGADIDPLPPSRAKRRKKDGDGPSMPALASMLLADPFVVRILLDRVLRSLRADVLAGTALPIGHSVVPSLLQLLYVAQFSTQLCAVRGKRFFIPDAGLTKAAEGESGEGGPSAAAADAPFASLRQYVPLLTRLLLESDLDRRMVLGGDLHDASSSLPPRPPADPKPWDGTSSLCVVRALAEGALANAVQPGRSTEVALAIQFPRFLAALGGLSGGNLTSERPFFASLARALLRHKHKLPHGTRDLVAAAWLGWIRGGKSVKGKSSNSMCAPVHECFIMLLNDWTNFGNVVLPRDTMLSLAEDAAKAAEASGDGTAKAPTFVLSWKEASDAFAPVKAQYDRMLSNIPEANASQWKEKMGIDDASLAVLTGQGKPKEEAKSDEAKDEDDKMDVDKQSTG